jgi:hypothetical protein
MVCGATHFTGSPADRGTIDRGCTVGFALVWRLPTRAHRGVMVVVDDADTVAALAEPGGPLGTQFLAANWVPKLANSIP